MDVMSIYGPNKQEVARDGCIAISNLAGNNDFNKAKLGQTGICPVLCDAIKAHVTDPEVTAEGCRAISALAQNSAENRVKLSQAGACRIALDIVQNNMSKVEIVRKGLSAIANLATNGDNKSKLEQAGAGAVTVQALQVHSEDREVS